MDAKTRCLIFDPFAGISGDMVLGALVDLGSGDAWLRELVASLPLDVRVEVSSVLRASLAATSVTVETSETEPERRLDDVLEIIDAIPVDPAARDIATETFRRLAEIEAALHGVAPDQVHFHEVGAADAIVDILGTAVGVTRLDVDRCFTRPVAIGHGRVDSAHGSLPLPAPATLRLLEGLPILETDLPEELTTPTGAALLAALTARDPQPRSYVPVRSGYGAGSRDPSGRPNALRLILAEMEPGGPVLILQADIDDMPPEYLPPLIEAVLAAGAIDVSSHPLQMKKGRTGFRIEALVPDSDRQTVAEALLEGSTTLGLRFWPIERQVLPRSTRTLEWRGFQIRLKVTVTPHGHVRCKPEYQDIVEAARALKIPTWQVRQEIETALPGGLER
ncbi:MAG: nickel pincer cofactor biosynthesis protein LarC [Gemmatimonadetes bacterium]|uniref:Putative nickel insertion protein n=1 Tax=Candidatus Kutchimonas denitrificans TaxID=3056748 RepID=A0AAE4ZBL8_9BACT|nr:nickel pincer cofactor biosynthesis protein LarC [Gemmatimonadota bacterium]NIR75266.1 nickel pincer cofactor biosynthesis protein LarC [Candidatus Kutchimonas denitrificans]NIS00204.1 nickel pincer cofactor biosynthesis protein LarC [Gemmatimonadota bacterium]NIT65796.1 nickel pincer cofactor biosynthesis protein LarC [Gemmatimonadota bacterium]NIU53074.1 nickel pincer cofactor biosynthesis protein LarC [Gemmatimonadota bacterium]